MRQQTLADEGFERYRKRTRREQFLDEMDKIVPWKGLCEVIEPFYPKPEGAGRPPIGLQRMLRIHFLQHWFNLSDPAVEEALYDSRAMRRFVGIDLGREPAPDETTVCKFRHLLEAHNLGDQLFALIAEYLEDNGLTVNTGNVQIAVDAKHNLIAEQQVHDNVTDIGLLAQTAVAARENLAIERIEAVADKGYYKIGDIEACQAAGVNGVLWRATGLRMGIFPVFTSRF